LLAFDYEADFDSNTNLMNEAKSKIKTIEVTHAVRSSKMNGLKIKRKQAIGFLDGELLATGKTMPEVINNVLAKIDLNNCEIITIYYGADVEPDAADEISAGIREQHPRLQVEVVKGGQPHYDYIMSVE
ncbi:MAG: DAK2 domain-containing protein, partial [Chloroflexota bacterium]